MLVTLSYVPVFTMGLVLGVSELFSVVAVTTYAAARYVTRWLTKRTLNSFGV